MSYVIGIDIGGTNTDAILIDEYNNIISWCKCPTSEPIELAVKSAINKLLLDSSIHHEQVKSVNIGTTHAINALLEGKNLYSVGVLRIAGHNPVIKPCTTWPDDKREIILSGVETVPGGFECDGRSISPFSAEETHEAIKRLIANGAESIAIIGVFSSIDDSHEKKSEAILRQLAGKDFPITLSNDMGGIGLIERESATILNCALKKTMQMGFVQLTVVCHELGLNCPVMITKNDGSLLDIDQALLHPLLTVSSGATNSFIGASKLANKENCVVIDVGGTSTDVGIVHNGYPRYSMHKSIIGDIPLNFPMPDTIALAIGGGSHVKKNHQQDWQVGPESVGAHLSEQALSFGGKTLTLTDIACEANLLSMKSATANHSGLSDEIITQILAQVDSQVEAASERVKSNKSELDVVLVGGGAPIITNTKGVLPKHYDVANAYGAALAEISGSINTVVCLDNKEETLALLKQKAIDTAANNGANKGAIRIVDIQIIPFHYMPGNRANIIVRASGPRAM